MFFFGTLASLSPNEIYAGMKFWTRLSIGVVMITELVSCGTHRPEALALPTAGIVSQETIAHACRQRTVHRQGTAGFEMLPDGKEAFLARLALVEAAQHTLDLQYYIWKDDFVGTVLVDRLLAAADRGVRVRLLLDATYGAQEEVRSAALAAHPNIQVAFFNPITDLKGIFAGNPLPVIGEIDRMQSRMHNKQLVADNALLIGGGRNLADTYFGIDRRHNMHDLDFIAVGPVVTAAAKSFDLYWHSPLTHVGDVTKLTERERGQLQKLRTKIARKTNTLAAQSGRPFPLSLSRTESLQILRQMTARMIWAEYDFVADPPERMLRQKREASPVSQNVETALREARSDVVMHAAYFIPQSETLELLRQTTSRGVRVQVLTNSLASIDGMAAMAGIANRRADALDSGLQLAELNAYAPDRASYIHARRMTPLGMHTKGIVVDDRVSFIGSYNMDPRSKYINTETGVVIRSTAFAARLKSHLLKDLQEQNCWQISKSANGSIRWTGGQPRSIRRLDPDASLARRLKYWFFRWVPWEDVL